MFSKPAIRRQSKYSIFRIFGNELPPRDEPGSRLRVLQFILDNEPEFANTNKCWVVNCIADREQRDLICKMLADRNMYYIVLPLWREKYNSAKNRSEKIVHAIGINRARNFAITHGHLLSEFTFVMDGDCFFTQGLWDKTIKELENDQRVNRHRKYYTVPTSRSTFDHALKSDEPMHLAEPMNVFRHDSEMLFDEKIAFGDGDKLMLLFKLNHSKEFGKHHILTDETLCKSVGMSHHVTGSSYEIELDTKLRITLRNQSIDNLLQQIDDPNAFPNYALRSHGKPNDYWKTIQGYFDFRGLYSNFAWEELNGSKIVEVGSWQGASTCYLATEIMNRQKDIELYAVDTWQGSDEDAHIKQIKEMGGSDVLFNRFNNNMSAAGVSHIVKPMRMTSIEASKQFEDNSVDVVFIDASHKYKDVLNDINHWYPKVKKGGKISGHDYVVGHKVSECGVIRAVHEFFLGKNLEISPAGRTWLHLK